MSGLRWSASAVAAAVIWAGMAVPAHAIAINDWNITATGVDAQTAWKTSRGASTVVGVIDTGISPHPDFTGSTTDLIGGNALPGYDFISRSDLTGDGDGWDANPTDEMRIATSNGPVPGWHGLHVAGIVAALDNGFGVTGVAPEAKVVPIRLVGMAGGVDTGNMDEAIRWGAGLSVEGAPVNRNPADVLNVSIAVEGSCPSAVQEAIDAATAEGVAVVVAAGNTWDAKTTGKRDPISGFFPGNCRGAITVTASDYLKGLTDYSNIGDSTVPATISAPGDVMSTCNSGDPYCKDGYAWSSGTSMSAPHVAAVIALLRSAQPYLTVSQLTEAITNSATPFAPATQSSPCTARAVCGAGIINAAAALSYAGAHFSSPTPTETPTSDPTPTATATPTPTLSDTPTPSPTLTSSPSPTDVPSPTPTPTPTLSDTPTPSPTSSPSPTPTPTDAPSPTPTPTPGDAQTSPAPQPVPEPSPAPSPVSGPNPSLGSENPAPAPAQQPPIELLSRPKATGTFRVGYKVKASHGIWSPTPARVSFQWYRGDKKISKATKASYRLTRSDRSKKIKVMVTVSRTGYPTARATSSSHKVK